MIRWRLNSSTFVREVFRVTPDPWQQEALDAYDKHHQLALVACKGPGKTACLAWIAWHFLLTRPYPKIAATSISGDNLSDCLWTEMARWQRESSLLTKKFKWTKTRIFLRSDPENWWMSARTWPKTGDKGQQANTLAGLHADYLLFIIDEAGGVPDAVMAAAEAGLSTGKECKIVIAGNPTHLEGPLYRASTTDRANWYVINITGDPDDPKRSPRISIEWARKQITKYGKDNPWVLVNVFGKFPPGSINALIDVNIVNAAIAREYTPDMYDIYVKRLGVDVARFGDDLNVIFPRQGLIAFRPVELRNARTHEIASRVALAKHNWQSDEEYIDGTGGWGAGVVDSLLQAGHNPFEIMFNGKATDDQKFFNKRSEMWFRMADWLKRGAIPNVPELIAELTTPTYTFQNGKFRLEEKDQIKERLGRSPNYADALALTFCEPDRHKESTIETLFGSDHQRKNDLDVDPYGDDNF